MELETHKDNTIHMMSGALDAQMIGPTQKIFQELLTDNVADITLDLSSVDFMDSSGVGSIVYLHKRLVADNRALFLSGLSGQPKKIIEFLRIDKIIKVVN
jgi:anti-anti-sigma factor